MAGITAISLLLLANIAVGSVNSGWGAKHVHTSKCNHMVNNNRNVNKNLNVNKNQNVNKNLNVNKNQNVNKNLNVNKNRNINKNQNVNRSNNNLKTTSVAKINGSGNSKNYNKTTSSAKATGGSAQQKQSQSQSLNNSGNSSATAVSGDVLANGAIQVSDNSSTVYKAARIPVNTAWAAPLVASDDTCMGSTSAGGQGITIGLSFSTTWSDSDCVIRKDARFLHNAHRPDIALSLMCSKKSVKDAVRRAGTDAEKRNCGLLEPAPTVTEEYGEKG